MGSFTHLEVVGRGSEHNFKRLKKLDNRRATFPALESMHCQYIILKT